MILSSLSYMSYLQILTKAMNDVMPFLLLQLKLMRSSQEWRKHERAYLQYIYCKAKPRIQRELSHTIKSRCVCVWMYMMDICMVANLILLCSLETYLSFEIWKHLLESRGYLIHLFFFSGGHLSTHCFGYLGHFCVHFFSSLFYSFLSLFLNNFCIAHASFPQQNF